MESGREVRRWGFVTPLEHTCREEAAMREVEEAGGLTVLIFQMCVLDLMISYRPLFFGL